MRKGIAVLAGILTLCLLPATWTAGQTGGSFPVFVSGFGSQEIFSIDSSTGAVTTIFTGDSNFFPEDVVVGPDDKLYVCDAPGDRIFRMDQNGGNVEVVYDRSLVQAGPEGPEGPSFGPGDDLYFNTRGPNHSGIWRIEDVAATPVGPFPAPVQVLDETETGSTFGEGTAWSQTGDLLIVDRSNSQVMVSSPPFGSASVFANFSGTPFGIDVDSVGDVFVAVNDTGGNRVLRFDDAGNSQGVWASFNNSVNFIEFDAADNLWVVTSDAGTGANGNLHKVDPNQGIMTITQTALPGGVGLAVPATSTSRTQTFDDNNEEQIYDFGSSTLKISDDIDGTCDVTVTAFEVSPQEVAARTAAFFPDSECVRYSGLDGYCVVYRVEPFPLPSCFTGNIELLLKYFAETELSQPLFLHDPSDFPGDDFSEDILVEFLPLADPDNPDDPGMRGSTDNFQEFVAANNEVPADASFTGFESPLRADGSASFESGATIPVKFGLVDGDGNPIAHAVFQLEVERLAPNPGPVPVESAGDSNQGTFFRYDAAEDRYVFNLSTDGYVSGDYEIRVTSAFLATQTVEFRIR